MAEKDVPLDHLLDHPDNAHVVVPGDRAKIGNNIRRTGRYPALIVRELDENSEQYPGEPGWFQILDGHQRKSIFQELIEEGLTQFALVHVDDWSPLTDDEALIALATLNSWGDNVPRKRAELLHRISEFAALPDMANILPESARQIEDAKKLLLRPVASIKKLVERAEQPDVVELAFAVGGDKKSTQARFTAAIQLLAEYYGAHLVESKHLDGAPPRMSIFTFQIGTPSQDVVQQAINRAQAGLAPGTKNRRGRALEEMAQFYLAHCLKQEGLPEAVLDIDIGQEKPTRGRRKSA